MDETKLPLTHHLTELRSRLIKYLITLSIAFVITYSFSNYIFDFLKAPILSVLPTETRNLYYTGLLEKFLANIKLAFYAAIFFTIPFLFYHLWRFISPGLYDKEKKYIAPFIISSTVLFLIGLLFAYLAVFPYGFKFLLNYGSQADKPIITIKEYLNISTKLLLVFGIVFETPILLIFLSLVGAIRVEQLVKGRRYAIVIIAIISALLTPPDVFTMIVMMVPMYLLYEISILVVKLWKKRSMENSTPLR